MLTKDIYHTIGLFLSFKDIANLMLCSKTHYRYLTLDVFWRRKLKMDYPYFELSDDDRARGLYAILSNRQTLAYDWKAMLTPTDNISEHISANFETPMPEPNFGYCDENVPNDVKARGYQVLADLRKQVFHLDRQRIEDQFERICEKFSSYELTRVDDHTLKTFKLNDEVTVWFDFNNQHRHLSCDRNEVMDAVRRSCRKHQWPVAETNVKVVNNISKNKIRFVSYFNATYTIDMIGVGNSDGNDYSYGPEDSDSYDLAAEMIVIHNHRENYFLILGCDGHAFIESTDFCYGCSDGDGSNLEFAFELNRILDMADVFYQSWTNCGFDEDDVDD